MSGQHSHRFPRSRRLCDGDFAAVVHSGKVFRGQGLVILLKKTGMTASRFGVVVPKRFVPSAVHRNRSKRILREWFRHNGMRLMDRDCVIRITAPIGNGIGRRSLITKIEQLLSTTLPK